MKLGVFITLTLSCQNNNQMNEKFEWGETISCPPGYPVDVYRGGLQSVDGGFTSLYLGTHSGIEGWGSEGRSMSDGKKTVPNHLHVIWLSYAEDCFYEVDTDIDYEKMVKLFKQGYYTPSSSASRPEPFKEKYNRIIVGFAPGGTVVVWLAGVGRQIEIGSYQGKKATIPQDQIDQLDYPIKNIFDPEYRKNILKNPGIVPKEIQEENKTQPIPFGLWDSYRKKYNWKASFKLPDNGISKKIIFYYYNGEREILFGQSEINKYVDIPSELKWNNLKKPPIPKELKISWLNNNILYVGEIAFNEKEIFSAFEEVFREHPEGKAELIIRVNNAQDDASILLSGNGKEIWIKDSVIEIFDTSKY
ncbi:DUF2931 family protein [Apibacter sp. HY039]|uniref:DUF2931 family protein n=1 Tax=Apibacter sp. HY039 TaxID=2501476 RepID=UPI0013E3BF39|nr:DUF2931 family protein [Apibacter sp. HY039]